MRVTGAIILVMGCGGNPQGMVDAPGTGGDVMVDTGAQLACAYTEHDDATNNATANAEATAITIAAPMLLCGSIDTGHFNGTTLSADIDAYRITVAADSDLLIRVYGAGAETLDRVVIQLLTTSGTSRGFGTFNGDHGAFAIHVAAGDYVIGVSAFNATAPASAIAYKVRLELDTPATRCPTVTTTTEYPEAHDGGGNNMNDMVRFDEAASPQTTLTPSAADTPEPTGLTPAVGSKHRLTGIAENVDPNDSYMDRDTYEFTTGPGVNEMSIRLDWTAVDVDFDYLVLPQNSARAFAGGLTPGLASPEFQTFGVKPSTTYWFWVGAYDGATLPATYDASICADTFTP